MTGQMYVRPTGTEGDWSPVGVGNVDILFDKDEDGAVECDPEAVRSTVSGSWSITCPIKINRLEWRTWRRMFGLPNPPLIHNGKKPRH